LVYLNAQSLRRNTKRLAFEFEVVKQYELPDVIVVTESWLNEEIPTSLFRCSSQYNVYRFDRPEQAGGGVVIFVKNSIRSYEISVPGVEGLEYVLVALVKGKQKLFLGAVYKPNVTDVHLLGPLKQFVNYVTSKRGKHVIIGDFNLPNVNWEALTAPEAGKQRSFMQVFSKLGYMQHVKEPTRGGNILDLIFTDEKGLISEVKVANRFSTSDHNIVAAQLAFGVPCEVKQIRTCWHRGAYDELCGLLLQYNWRSLFSDCFDINDMYNAFVCLCQSAISLFVPREVVTEKVKQTLAMRNALKRKAKCHRIYKQESTDASLNDLNVATAAVESILYSEAHKHEMSLLDEPNVRRFYGYVNSKLRSNRRMGVIVENGEPVDDVRKSELFSEQFSSVFITDNGVPGVLRDRNVAVPLTDQVFTDLNVSSALSALAKKVTCGEDGLPAIFLRQCRLAVIEPLKLLFQYSFETSVLPQFWRDAAVVPVYKNKGSYSDVSNHRPISLTSVPCRVMESILKTSLVDHLLRNGLVSRYQHGFLSRRSTMTNLLCCLNQWFSSINKRECVDVMYIDIAKAFDSVSHSKLLYKLRMYGVTGKFLQWIAAFLNQRRQRVKIGSTMSNFANVTSGVPQGSVLGPVLFLIYINDIADVLKNCSVSIFADDSKIYFRANSATDIAVIQSDIDRIQSWCDEWQLSIAANKCSMLHLGRANVNNLYTMGATNIPVVRMVKDLGITISADLSFSPHITQITKNAFARINLIFRAFTTRDINCLLKAYIAYVRPLVEYNTPVWSPFLVSDISKVERVQRYFTRRLPGFQEFSYMERLSRLGLETLEQRRIRYDLIEVFKIVKNMSVLRFEDFFEYKPNIGTRGHSLQLKHRWMPRLDVCKHFFANRVVKIWNDLPQEAVEACTVPQFRRAMSSEFLRRHCKYVP
jgi:hypothetical protein